MVDLKEDAFLPFIWRSRRTIYRPSRFGADALFGVNDGAIASEDSGHGLRPADSKNFLENSGQVEDPISLEDLHQESASDSVPDQKVIPTANKKIDRPIWGNEQSGVS